VSEATYKLKQVVHALAVGRVIVSSDPPAVTHGSQALEIVTCDFRGLEGVRVTSKTKKVQSVVQKVDETDGESLKVCEKFVRPGARLT
jgi:hypothetical protein